MLTGDRGIFDQGYIRFVGRDDDLHPRPDIALALPVEDCLLTHPAVATVGCGQTRSDAHRNRKGLCGFEAWLRLLMNA